MHKHLLRVCALVVALFAVAFAQSPSSANTELARRSDDFVASICVNTHAAYSTGPYANLATTGLTQLLQLGASCIRDGAVHNGTGGHDTKLQTMGAAGIHGSLTFAYTDNAAWISGEAALVSPFVMDACESQNEPNSTMGASFAATLLPWETGTLIPNCPAGTPIYGASPTYANAAVNYTDHSSNSAIPWYANFHGYQSGHNPENTGFGSNGYGSEIANIAYGRLGGYTLGIVETEWGYCQYSGTSGVPVNTQAKYIARSYLNNFNLGVRRSAMYEMYDESNDSTVLFQGCGLFYNDASPKPAAIYLQNLINTVQDRAQAFTPDSLNFSFSGTTANLNHTLLEKHDGTMVIPMWLGVSSYDVNNKVATPVTAQTVSLNIGGGRVTTGATLTTISDSGAATTSSLSFTSGSANITFSSDNVYIVTLPSVGTPAVLAQATAPPNPTASAIPATPAPAPTGFISIQAGPNSQTVSPVAVDSPIASGGATPSGWTVYNGNTRESQSAQFPFVGSLVPSASPAPTKTGTYASFPTAFGYSANGSPDAALSSITTAPYIEGAGSSYNITVLADRTPRDLRVWYNAECVVPKVYASLSDTSYGFQSAVLSSDTSGNASRYIDVLYKAGSGSQSLTFALQILTDNGTTSCTPIAETDGVGALSIRAANVTLSTAFTMAPLVRAKTFAVSEEGASTTGAAFGSWVNAKPYLDLVRVSSDNAASAHAAGIQTASYADGGLISSSSYSPGANPGIPDGSAFPSTAFYHDASSNPLTTSYNGIIQQREGDPSQASWRSTMLAAEPTSNYDLLFPTTRALRTSGPTYRNASASGLSRPERILVRAAA